MHELDDLALLRDFAERGSETAFAELVGRHVNKVYSVALRHTRNPHSAEEITQAVFVILARKAGTLGQNVILSGWLYQTARLAAMTLIRGEIRRARREQEALMQTSPNEPADDGWPHIAPLLDDAMARLSERDRHAVVLRYFDGKSLREVGAALGGSEDAAKMRVSRAVEKLRAFFAKQGVALSAAAIAGAVSANSVQAAPATLAKSITAVALTKGATASGSTSTLIKGALKIMAWTKAKTAIVISAGILLALGTTVVVHHHQASSAGGARTMGIRPAQDVVGVGLLLRFDAPTKTINIQQTVPNSPAARAGLSRGLVVNKINGNSTTDMKLAECVSLIRGIPGTKVTLELAKPDGSEAKTVELTREKLQLP